MEFEEPFRSVYRIGGKLATRNLTPGRKVYGEELVRYKNAEYRAWNPYRSKLAAAIIKGMKGMKISEGSRVLYLGAATGTTPSHVSDIIGSKGRLFGVEISERNMREFVALCESRDNMLPILADAGHPEDYSDVVDNCDVIYQDIAVKNQAEVLMKNSGMLDSGGYAYFVIKSQSVDISKAPEAVYRDELAKLKGTFEVLERIDIEPYDSMHLFVVLRKVH
ncbi:MAG: fibrillarin-like rRNA/tRNA 2'-O-methyltransferase [Candidatus Micrarchaeota archaeon]|nr:fibrillarin-like rRNA/tRNA 2'-O-methyltransferase [Candidatus Micrarchaeota archaeon]